MHRLPTLLAVIALSVVGAALKHAGNTLESLRAQLRATLEADGYTVVATSGGDDALSLFDNPQIKLVVTELYLGNRKSRCLLNAICTPSLRRRAKVLAYTFRVVSPTRTTP